MNAQELYELVKDWPKAAWPQWEDYGVKFSVTYAHGQFNGTNHTGQNVIGMNAPLAVLLFEASGLRWLDRHENHYTISTDNDGFGVYSACMGTEGKLMGRGPSKLHAIDAAIKEIA